MIHTLIQKIINNPDCHIIPPLKNYQTKLNLPNDLKEFYQYCNGVELFFERDYGYKILGIDEIKRTDLSIFGELLFDEPSIYWYNIAENDNGDYICIDLSNKNHGICYDAFYETYGLIDDMPIIANSFSDLLSRLYQNNGNYPYWQNITFKEIYGFYQS